MRYYYYDKDNLEHRLDGPAQVEGSSHSTTGYSYDWYYHGTQTIFTWESIPSIGKLTNHLDKIFYDHTPEYKTDIEGFRTFMTDIVNRIAKNVGADEEYRLAVLDWLEGRLSSHHRMNQRRAEIRKKAEENKARERGQLDEGVNKKSEDGRWVNFYYYNKEGEQHRLDGPAELLHTRFGSYTINWFVKDEYAGSSDYSALIHKTETIDVPEEFISEMIGNEYSSNEIASTLMNLKKIGYKLPENALSFLKQHKFFKDEYGGTDEN